MQMTPLHNNEAREVKNRMQIIKTPQESHNISVFWEELEETERQIFHWTFALRTLTYPIEKASNLPPFFFVCLSYKRHSRELLLVLKVVYNAITLPEEIINIHDLNRTSSFLLTH